MEHNISLKGRNNLVISGVEHIYSFNDKRVEIKTSAGEMVIAVSYTHLKVMHI